jgi:uncharacterized protein YecE (DUF72 family)
LHTIAVTQMLNMPTSLRPSVPLSKAEKCPLTKDLSEIRGYQDLTEELTLKRYLIGAGGWAYFQVPGLNPLVAYSKVFNFVEVNSTFYQMPSLQEAERWRKLVPADFEFSVRAHRSITHKHRFQPTQEAFEAFERMERICDVLKADIFHFQIPTSFKLDQTSINNISNFLASTSPAKTRLALELRGLQYSEIPSSLLNTMRDNKVVHCVDLSRGETPAYESDILYTRLFGKGKHNVYQPTDEELAEIDKKASSAKSERIVMSFHFVRMYKDAARLKMYKQTGNFPSITGSTGLSSLEEVLKEDARFPATKQELIRTQGWKLFDLTKTERVRAGEVLEKVPEGSYNNMGELAHELRSVMG